MRRRVIANQDERIKFRQNFLERVEDLISADDVESIDKI